MMMIRKEETGNKEKMEKNEGKHFKKCRLDIFLGKLFTSLFHVAT